MATKILHVSDTHLGKSQYQSAARKRDFPDAFDAIMALARDENVDAVIHTGDLFDRQMVNTPSMVRCLDAIESLGDIPFYAIIGDHERKRESQWMDIIEHIGNAYRLGEIPTVITDVDGNNPVSVYGIDAVRSPNWESKSFDLPMPDEGHFSLVCMHELFAPLVTDKRKQPYDLEKTLNRFTWKPDALALGDYHSTTAKSVSGVDAFYPGATERCSVKETSSPCVYILEIEDGKLDRYTRTVESAGHENTPRDFIVVPVEFSEGQGISKVERRIDEELGPEEDATDKVVYVKLLGEDVPVTTSDVYDVLEARNCTVPNVVDKRVVDIDLDVEVEDTDGEDIEQMVDDAVSGLELTELIEEAEDLVRDRSVNDSELESRVNTLIADKQEDKFGEATVNSRD